MITILATSVWLVTPWITDSVVFLTLTYVLVPNLHTNIYYRWLDILAPISPLFFLYFYNAEGFFHWFGCYTVTYYTSLLCTFQFWIQILLTSRFCSLCLKDQNRNRTTLSCNLVLFEVTKVINSSFFTIQKCIQVENRNYYIILIKTCWCYNYICIYIIIDYVVNDEWWMQNFENDDRDYLKKGGRRFLF